MLIITLGVPGAGKATIAKRLEKYFNFKTIATGEMLRHEVYKDSELGKKIKAIMAKGHLVSDQIAIDLVEEEMKKKGDIILEGFPRNLYQAEKLNRMLEDYGKTIDVVLHFKVDDEIIYDRLSGRRVCPECNSIYHLKHFPTKTQGICDKCGHEIIQRDDDDFEVVKTKLAEYRKELAKKTS